MGSPLLPLVAFGGPFSPPPPPPRPSPRPFPSPDTRPRNPRCPGIGVYIPDPGKIGIPYFPNPGFRPNRDARFPESRIPAKSGFPDFPKSRPNRIGAQIPNIFPIPPNRDRENPGYFPGQIGMGRDRDSGISGSGRHAPPGQIYTHAHTHTQTHARARARPWWRQLTPESAAPLAPATPTVTPLGLGQAAPGPGVPAPDAALPLPWPARHFAALTQLARRSRASYHS